MSGVRINVPIKETSSSLEEMASMTKQNADNAGRLQTDTALACHTNPGGLQGRLIGPLHPNKTIKARQYRSALPGFDRDRPPPR